MNQFYSIYSLNIPAAGSFVTRGIRQSAGSGNMYVVAVIPEPGMAAIWVLGFGVMAIFRRNR